jgi:hypothetical protein
MEKRVISDRTKSKGILSALLASIQMKMEPLDAIEVDALRRNHMRNGDPT